MTTIDGSLSKTNSFAVISAYEQYDTGTAFPLSLLRVMIVAVDKRHLCLFRLEEAAFFLIAF
ncbi:hypothetical protein ACFO4N_11030 [Camelliibacillus cellulosilyticus]|uniref:Uncharacterized protein n=1 Tax=Camelliibacillus cellulosilyticus TaxID=2174486 RepID=A0ABV9GMP2_9BACL